MIKSTYLNNDLWRHTFTYLTHQEQLDVSRVNSSWQNLTNSLPWKSTVDLSMRPQLPSLYSVIPRKPNLTQLTLKANLNNLTSLPAFLEQIPLLNHGETKLSYNLDENSPANFPRDWLTLAIRPLHTRQLNVRSLQLIHAQEKTISTLCAQKPNLKNLCLINCRMPASLKFLADLQELTTLDLIYCYFPLGHDLEVNLIPEYCPNLTELSLIQNNPITFSLNFAKPFTRLSKLHLNHISLPTSNHLRFNEISPVLQNLQLEEMITLTSLEYIPSGVTSLNLNNSAIATAELSRHIPRLSSLQELTLFNCSNLTSLKCLYGHPSLQKLDVHRRFIRDPQEFAELLNSLPHLDLNFGPSLTSL